MRTLYIMPCPETSTKLYVHEFGFWWCCRRLGCYSISILVAAAKSCRWCYWLNPRYINASVAGSALLLLLQCVTAAVAVRYCCCCRPLLLLLQCVTATVAVRYPCYCSALLLLFQCVTADVAVPYYCCCRAVLLAILLLYLCTPPPRS